MTLLSASCVTLHEPFGVLFDSAPVLLCFCDDGVISNCLCGDSGIRAERHGLPNTLITTMRDVANKNYQDVTRYERVSFICELLSEFQAYHTADNHNVHKIADIRHRQKKLDLAPPIRHDEISFHHINIKRDVLLIL